MIPHPPLTATDKRLIFTVTTGRSGTGYLADFLQPIPNCTSTHEPEPSFASTMRACQGQPQIATDFWVTSKLPAINATAGRIYCETSHLFGLGFLEPLLALGIVPDLILLTREKRAVATSLYRLDTIPGRTEKGRTYYLSPDDPGVLPLPGWEMLHDYQLCFWYCLEIERRQRLYDCRWRESGHRAVWTSVAELRRLSGALAFLRSLQLRTSPHFWLRYILHRSVAINTKLAIKNTRPLPENITELEFDIASKFVDCQ